jgi:hypothetical protein
MFQVARPDAGPLAIAFGVALLAGGWSGLAKRLPWAKA